VPCSFRPRRFSRPRRLPPPTGSRACCIPHPILRFIGFPRSGAACLRSPLRFPSDACPPELFPSEELSPRHREALPPCRSPATPARLRGLVPLGSPSQPRLVAEPHCSMLSWASPLGAPPKRDSLRHARERAALRGAKDPCIDGSIRWPVPRLQRHHGPKTAATPCARGRNKGGQHHCRPRCALDRDRLRHRTEVVSSPVSPGRTDVLPSQARGAPQVRRMPGQRHSPEGACTAAAFREVQGFLAAWFDRRSDRSHLLSRVP
jgi:hypothetical protein